jgi:hypothetical protein
MKLANHPLCRSTSLSDGIGSFAACGKRVPSVDLESGGRANIEKTSAL